MESRVIVLTNYSYSSAEFKTLFCRVHGGPIGFDAVPCTLLSEGDPPPLVYFLQQRSQPPRDNLSFRSPGLKVPGELVTEALIALIGPIKTRDSVTTKQKNLFAALFSIV